MTLFDIIAALVLGVSLIAGLVRGALREVTTVAAFVLAAFLSIFCLRFTGPIALKSMHPAWAATATAVIVVFLAVYILFRIMGSALARRVDRTQALGTLDRLIGGGFGLVRGLVLIGLFALVTGALIPADRTPDWIGRAKLYPLAQASATALRALAPRYMQAAQAIKPRIDKAMVDSVAAAARQGAKPAVDDAPAPAPAPKPRHGDAGYSAAARKALDEVVEKSR